MNDDKYIGIEVLTNVLNNVIEMVDQRTALLNSMFKEDLYNDFLMMEAMQGGMGGAGVDNVAPVNTGMNDLSLPQAPNDQNIINLEEAGLNPSDTGNTNLDNPNDDTTTQNYNKGAITPPTSGLSGNALNPFSSEEKPSSKSLEETGFNDVIERNISNSIADDFQIDQRLKDAFGSSLALPMKAAGVGLMGLLSRIPATDADMQNNIDNFLTQMSTSLGVSTESSTLNSSTDNKENIDLSTRIQNWVHKAADWLVSKPKNDDPMGGSVTKIHGINQGGGGIGSTISNFFGLAKDKDHEVSEETMMGAAVTGLQKRRQMNELYMEMLNGGGGGVSPNLTEPNQGGLTKIIETMSNTLNFNQNNLEGIKSTQNLINANDLSSTIADTSFITDLTNTVFQENSELLAAKYDTKVMSDAIANSMPSTIATKADIEGVGEMALSQVKQSVFFSEYANTAQFS
tara:strand:- start:17856 stop:19226 length:1371 start_codon:yes stop_codon:yes gene_type:complete